MNAMIDTLKASKSFEDAGFAKAQADTLAVAIAEAASTSREDLVTKEFLRAELAILRSDMVGQIATSKNDMVRWLLGSQVMVIVVLVALANFTKLVG